MTLDQPEFEFLDPPEKEGEIGRLGPYRVTGMLGKGGMGQVFCAEDGRLKRRVALKVMNQKFAATPNSKKRFVEEARAMAAVHHDNVATIFEVGLRSGMPFIAMEMLKGKTLEAYNSEGKRFSDAEILRLARDVASGLSAAHACGIVHRDIKPANIWIEENTGRAKILDFGLAIAGSDRFSKRGSVIGTPGYLSPEQARNEPLDDRTDLYSLGVVLYQMCVGKLPLTSDSVTGQMIAIIAHCPRPLTDYKRDVPQPICDLVGQLLEKEPRKRPRDAVQLRQQVIDVAGRCRDDSQSAMQIVTDVTAATTKRTNKASAKPTMRQKPHWVPWAVGSAAALVVLTLVIYFSRPERVASIPAPPVDRAPKPTREVVRAASLSPLKLMPVTARLTRVKNGDAARFQMRIQNDAADARSDPRQLDANIAAHVVTYFKTEGRDKRKAPVFPRKLRPNQLPVPGQSEQIEIQLMTGNLPPGEFQVIFELQTPGGVMVDSSTTGLTVTENLSVGDLLGFETLRTHNGGADVHVGNRIKNGTGTSGVLNLQRKGKGNSQVKQHVYLHFDLSKNPIPKAKVDRAVLLLTLTGDSHQSTSTFNVYGVPEQIIGNWDDSESGPLNWEKAPSRTGVQSLTYLAQVTIDNGGNSLKDVADGIRVDDPNLDDFLRSAPGDLVTLLLVPETVSDKPISFASKEGKPKRSPALAIRGR